MDTMKSALIGSGKHGLVGGLPPYTAARNSYESMKLVAAADLSAETEKLVKIDQVGSLCNICEKPLR